MPRRIERGRRLRVRVAEPAIVEVNVDTGAHGAVDRAPGRCAVPGHCVRGSPRGSPGAELRPSYLRVYVHVNDREGNEHNYSFRVRVTR